MGYMGYMGRPSESHTRKSNFLKKMTKNTQISAQETRFDVHPKNKNVSVSCGPLGPPDFIPVALNGASRLS